MSEHIGYREPGLIYRFVWSEKPSQFNGNNGGNELGRFLSDIRKYPSLTNEEINEIYRRIEYCQEMIRAYSGAHSAGLCLAPESGLEDAIDQVANGYEGEIHELKQKIICASLTRVVAIAKGYRRYSNYSLSLSDIIQEGTLGLLEAVDKFDYKRGYSFLNYAHRYIKTAINKAVRDNRYIVRVPVYVQCIRSKLKRVMEELLGHENYSEDSKTVTEKGLAAKTGLIVSRIRRCLTEPPIEYSIKEFTNEGGEVYVQDIHAQDPEEAITDLELKTGLERALELVKPREKKVLIMRFGLNEQGERTLEEVGAEIGRVTRERVRQIEARALRKLRNNSEVRGHLESFWEPID